MVNLVKRALLLGLGTLVFATTTHSQTPDTPAGTIDSNQNVQVEVRPESNVSTQTGGNVFDFSNNSGRNTPPGPNLPSFAGGPCMGASGGLSAAGPGFAIGGGRSVEDEACQRRNWVQTLVGVSQHMPEVEANELKRVAIAVMMQDEYLAPAFEALGYNLNNLNPSARPTVQPGAAGATKRQPSATVAAPVNGVMAQVCTTVIPANASPQFRQVLAARGCTVQSR